MKKLILLVTAIIFLAGCSGSSDSSESNGHYDWTFSRADAALSGFTSATLPKNPTLLWSVKGEGYTISSPVVKNGTTYWCDKRGEIRGIDLNGNLTFDFDLQTAVEATPFIHDSILYIGRIDGLLSAISIPQKKILWHFETLGQISATPNYVRFADQDAIVFGSYDNFLYCVNAVTGKEISRFESGYYLNGAVALAGNSMIFGGCDAWLRVINSQNGIATDSLLLDAYVPASPAIMGEFCYIGDYSGTIYELQVERGKIITHKKINQSSGEEGFVSTPAISPESLFFLSDSRYLLAVNRKNGSTRWKYMLKGNSGESSPIVCQDKLIVCTKNGIISILDAGRGELLWEYDAGEQIVGSPAIIKDHFLVLTAKGTLLCFGQQKKQ